MNLPFLHSSPSADPRQLNPGQHLNHEQLCDLLLSDDLDPHALHGDTLLSPDASDLIETYRQHIVGCLICSSELDLLRSSVAGFQAVANTVTHRELARRPLSTPAVPVLARSRVFVTPAFFWAASALLFAAVIPLGILSLRLNPLLRPGTDVTQSASGSATATFTRSQSESDAALLEGIDEDLSVAIPAPMRPLAVTAGVPASAPLNTD